MFLNFTTAYVTILLGLIAILGDFIVSHAKLHLFQAIFDNFTHGLIGGLSWFIVCFKSKSYTHSQKLTETFLCAIVASLIDLDHFVAARSLLLRDATNLRGRPPLHSSTIPWGFCVILFICGTFFDWRFIKRSSLLIFLAFASHHIRDATRRGFWFAPFGSTQPIPYFVYVLMTCLLPHFVSLLQFIDLKEVSSSLDKDKEIVI